MDWLTFVSKLIEALAWPLVVIGAVLVLRLPLSKVIPTLRGLRYRDLELDFGNRLEELEARAESAELPVPTERPAWTLQDPEEWTPGDYVERLAPISPRAAIAEAWRYVELAIRDSARRAHKPEPRTGISMLAFLEQEKAIPRDVVSLLEDLRQLRNQAVHAKDFELEPEQAVHFGELAVRLIATLKVSESKDEQGPANSEMDPIQGDPF